MRRAGLFASALAASVTIVTMGGTSVGAATPGAQFVLSPEGNHLWAYDAASGERQLVIHGVNASDPGVVAPPGSQPRDINGQICISPDGRHAITGEDTVIAEEDGADTDASHDPRIAGWGLFRITGSTLGTIRMGQIGKLAPEGGTGPGYTGDPDNQGCGFLDDTRLFTTAIGDTLPGEPANGQLFLWFAPFDAGYEEIHADGVEYFVGEVDHCQIDDTLATAGGIAIDGSDVYVASNRPDDAGNAGAVWRYSGDWPATVDQCTDEYLAEHVTKTMIVPPVPVPVNPISPTPSSVAISPADTLYVSSVFTGTVSEYTKDGMFVRDIWPTSPVAPRTGPTGDTPFGLAFTDDGSLWIADLGIVGDGPSAGEGSLIRVAFDDAGDPAPFGETVQDGLTFPDGLGVYTPVPDHAAGPSRDQPAAAVEPARSIARTQVAAAADTLPVTGGGAAALALLALGVGWLLRRARPSAATEEDT